MTGARGAVLATNWAGNVSYRAARVHQPATLAELRRTVARSERIRAIGSGHSFSLVADTMHDLVRLDRLPRTVEIDRGGMTAAVGAGMTYAEVADELHRAGYALGNLASLPHIALAGACATGTHGSGDTQRVLGGAVTALQLVGPGGDLVELHRGADAVFPGAVVALGALGVVTRLTLEIQPSFEVAQQVRLEIPLDELVERFDDVFSAAYSVSAFTDWRSGHASAWLKRRTDAPESPWSGGRAAERPVHMCPGVAADSCTEQLDVAGPSHERLPHFRSEHRPGAGKELQSEFFLPRSGAGAALTALRGIADVVAPVLQISEVRTVRGDDLWLSPAYGRDSATIHFTWIDDAAAVAPALAAVEDCLAQFGARPHWGKLTTIPPEEVAARYERADDFTRLAQTLDPTGKFRNDFVDRLFPSW